MKKAFRVVIFIICISLLFSSCSKSSRRINDLTIVQAFAIDENRGKTEVEIQYLNLFANSGNTDQLQGNITDVSESAGDNISSAVFNASKTVSEDIFFGQNKVIVFGLDYAQKNIDEGIEYLLKSYDSRPDVLVSIGIPNAKSIVKSKENGAKIPAENIYSLMKLGEENGHSPAVTVCDLLNLYNDETSDIYLPVLSAENDNAKCEGTAIFSEGKYVAMLNENETFGFLLAKNKLRGGILTVEVANIGTISVDISYSKANKYVEIKNEKPVFCIDISAKLVVTETGKTIKSILSESDYKNIQAACEKQMKKLCINAVSKCFKNKSDPFMCARYLYMKNTGLYKEMKPVWKSNLEKIEIKTTVTSTLQRINNNTA